MAQAGFGASLLQRAANAFKGMSNGLRAAVIGLALTAAAPTTAMADTVFLDHNDAPMEIKVARELAASKGEPFVLVRPDQTSLDSLFARAERGEVNIRHLILSGHSNGMTVWGEGQNGEHHQTSFDQMQAFQGKYPKAFAQVQHVTFMSCYAGSAGNSASWGGIFTNARAISGFHAYGPSKTQPAAQKMLRNTELAMRTLEGKGRLSPQQALVMAKQIAQKPGSNVTNFGIRLDGVHYGLGVKTTSVERAMDLVEGLDAQAFMPYFEARPGFESPPTNHSRSELRDFYNALHGLGNALPADHPDRPVLTERIDQTIRLIYFDAIAAKFSVAHHDVIDAAAKEAIANPGLGISIPADLSTLSRAQIVQLNNKLAEMDLETAPGLKAFRDILYDGLVQLTPSAIPATWID